LEHLYNCIHRPKATKPHSATYAYPLAIGHHTCPYIQPTTQLWHDHLWVPRYSTQSQQCILVIHRDFLSSQDSQTDTWHVLVT
jgi:hypothetical protein